MALRYRVPPDSRFLGSDVSAAQIACVKLPTGEGHGVKGRDCGKSEEGQSRCEDGALILYLRQQPLVHTITKHNRCQRQCWMSLAVHIPYSVTAAAGGKLSWRGCCLVSDSRSLLEMRHHFILGAVPGSRDNVDSHTNQWL